MKQLQRDLSTRLTSALSLLLAALFGIAFLISVSGCSDETSINETKVYTGCHTTAEINYMQNGEVTNKVLSYHKAEGYEHASTSFFDSKDLLIWDVPTDSIVNFRYVSGN